VPLGEAAGASRAGGYPTPICCGPSMAAGWSSFVATGPLLSLSTAGVCGISAALYRGLRPPKDGGPPERSGALSAVPSIRLFPGGGSSGPAGGRPGPAPPTIRAREARRGITSGSSKLDFWIRIHRPGRGGLGYSHVKIVDLPPTARTSSGSEGGGSPKLEASTRTAPFAWSTETVGVIHLEQGRRA